MNIYRVFFLFAFYITNETIGTLYKNKINLFMKKEKINNNLNLYTPKTINQSKYVKYLDDETNKIIITSGPAGTGKTLFACQKAIQELKNKNLEKIIITHPVVSVYENIGFLPGNTLKKMDPWSKQIFDIFLEYYSKSELDFMLNNGKIEICPLALMRRRTFKYSFIIADEMQNSSPNQMKMLTTRIGINTRIVITGDLFQTDFPKENGLYDFITKVKKYNNQEMIKFVKLENSDIERSEIVKKVIEIYNFNVRQQINIIPIQDIKPLNINNDASLIPKHHMTDNFDIF